MAGEQHRRKPDTRSGSSNSTNSEAESNKCSCQKEVHEIKIFLEALNNKFKVIENCHETVTALEKSVNFISSQYDTLIKISEENNSRMNEMSKEIQNLRTNNEINELKIKKLLEKTNQLEQYSRNANLEIHGLKLINDTDPKDLVMKLAEKINVPIAYNDVDIIHPMHSRSPNKHQVLLAQFSTRSKRDLLLSKRKYCITDNSFPGNTIGTTVYFNENMTTYYKHLHYLTKIQAKESNFKFVWFKNGKLFTKKNESSPAIIINNEEDIKKHLCDSVGVSSVIVGKKFNL